MDIKVYKGAGQKITTAAEFTGALIPDLLALVEAVSHTPAPLEEESDMERDRR